MMALKILCLAHASSLKYVGKYLNSYLTYSLGYLTENADWYPQSRIHHLSIPVLYLQSYPTGQLLTHENCMRVRRTKGRPRYISYRWHCLNVQLSLSAVFSSNSGLGHLSSLLGFPVLGSSLQSREERAENDWSLLKTHPRSEAYHFCSHSTGINQPCNPTAKQEDPGSTYSGWTFAHCVKGSTNLWLASSYLCHS
jgi:hypothetical protein